MQRMVKQILLDIKGITPWCAAWVVAIATYIIVYPSFSSNLRCFVIRWIEPWNLSVFAALLIAIDCVSVAYVIWALVRNRCITSGRLRFVTFFAAALYVIHRWFLLDYSFSGWKIRGVTFAYLDLLWIVVGGIIVTDVVYYIRFLFALLKREDTAPQSLLLDDNEVETKEEDLLNYSLVAEDLSSLLEDVDTGKHAYSVGINGKWGVGKSSLMNLFGQIQEDRGNIIITFSPRAAKSWKKIQEEFFVQFASVLGEYNREARPIVYQYAEALQAIDYVGWFFALITKHHNRDVENQKKKLNEIIRKIGKRIYVLIEDFDRLTKEEVLEVLKLIDANGSFCNTVFMTAFDKDQVNAILNEGQNIVSGGIYTDKYFQFEYPLVRAKTDTRTNLLNQYIFQYAIDLVQEDIRQKTMRSEWLQVSRYLLSELPTIRHIKRFVNQFQYAYGKCYADVSFGDFCVVMLIRHKDLSAYENLSDHVYTQFQGTTSVSHDALKLRKEYVERNASAKTSLPLTIYLQYLFPTGDDTNSIDDYQRIRRTNSFGNYFVDMYVGSLSYKELSRLFTIDSLADALLLLNKINIETHAKSIEEFLCSRSPEWIGSSDRMERWIILLFAAFDSHPESLNLWHTLAIRYLRDVFEDYRKAGIFKKQKDYLNIVDRAVKEVVNRYPVTTGKFYIKRASDNLESTPQADKFMDSTEYCQKVALLAAAAYDRLIETDEWIPEQSLGLVSIKTPTGEMIDSARSYIVDQLYKYQDKYASVMWTVTTDGENRSILSFRDINFMRLIFPNEWDFYRWILTIPNKSYREILRTLFLFESNEGGHIIHINEPFKALQDVTILCENIKDVISKKKTSARILQSKYVEAIKLPLPDKDFDAVPLNPKDCDLLLMGFYPNKKNKQSIEFAKEQFKNVAFLDMIPYRAKDQKTIERWPIEMQRDIAIVTHQEIVELHPRLIIYNSASTFYYWGSNSNHPWYGYHLDEVTQDKYGWSYPSEKYGKLYRILGLEHRDEAILTDDKTTLEGTYILQYGSETRLKQSKIIDEKTIAEIMRHIS